MMHEQPPRAPAWSTQRGGSPGGPPMVFLHGFMGSSADWLPLVGHIDADWLLVDLPGHGETPLGPKPSLDRWAVQLSRLIQHTFGGAAAVVGYSMGGRLALRLAAQAPETVLRFALISASPGLEDERERADRKALDQRRSDAILADFGDFRESWYSAPLFAMDPKEATRAARRRAEVDAAAAAVVVRELSPGREPSSWPILDDLPGPVLVAAGENDSKYATLTTRIAERLGERARPALIAEAGHSVHLDAPEKLARVIEAWMRE